MRHILEITCKETGKQEDITFYFETHKVRILNEEFNEIYNSENYLKTKEVDNDQKEKEGQKTENNKSE